MTEWPVLKPLPSYGRGRDAPGGRFMSLIFGTNLTDVIITGNWKFRALLDTKLSNIFQLNLTNKALFGIRGQWHNRRPGCILVAEIP